MAALHFGDEVYETSRALRIAATVLAGLYAVLGVDTLLSHHPGRALVFVLAAGLQCFALWSRYWEITPEGVIRSKGNGFDLRYQAAALRYAGPVRGPRPSGSFGRKKDIELQFEGARLKRYARVAERGAFLEQLRQVSPEAEIVRA